MLSNYSEFLKKVFLYGKVKKIKRLAIKNQNKEIEREDSLEKVIS